MKNIKFFLIYFIFITFSNCVKDVDFNQSEDISLTPVIESNIIYFNIPSDNFIAPDGSLIPFSQDYTDIRIFEDEFITDNLVKAELLMEFTNTINRNFSLYVEYLDESDISIHDFIIDMSSGTPDSPTTIIHNETFENASLDNLKLITKVRFTATLLDATPPTSNSGTIKAQSKGTFYLNINTSGE